MISRPTSQRLPLWRRPVGLALLLAFGLLASGALTPHPAHAQRAMTTTITTCDEATLDAAIASAASGDTISFGCSGDIKLTHPLTISKNLTLDGSGQSVILDGNSSVQVLAVNRGVSFTLKALTVAHGNAAGGSGSGLYNDGGTVTISSSTFANNSAIVGGGGLYNDGGTAIISDSTFANNVADTGGFTSWGGGGLFNFGTAIISDSTFANNSVIYGGGGDLYNFGTLQLSTSIIANNSGVTNNCANSLTDQGYNLSNDGSCGLTASTSQQNVDPKLTTALANNGGPTQTLALLQGSPAIDKIPAASCPTSDQRGVARPDNGETTCDIGAYEFVDPVDKDLALTGLPGNLTVDATSPQGAVVTYTAPTATDEAGDNPGPSVSCTPASGSTFAIGMTTVTCTASDSDDTNSPVSASFTVTVNGATTQISNLITTVNSFHFSKNIQTSLDVELQVALYGVNHNKPKVACAALAVFRLEVTKLTGHGITSSQASQLLASAKQIQMVIGC